MNAAKQNDVLIVKQVRGADRLRTAAVPAALAALSLTFLAAGVSAVKEDAVKTACPAAKPAKAIGVSTPQVAVRPAAVSAVQIRTAGG